MKSQDLPDHIQKLHDHGEECLQKVLAILNTWPVGEYCRRVDFEIRTPADRKAIRELIHEIERWVDALARQRANHDQRKLTDLTEILKFALMKEDYKDNAIEDAECVRHELLLLVKTMPIIRHADRESYLCISEREPSVQRYRTRAHSRTYRQRNPKFQRKV